MPNRGFRTVIVVFWIGMMAWYIYQDVLPTAFRSAPDYRYFVRQDITSGPTYWQIYQDDRVVGQAQSETARQLDGSVTLTSEATFSELPVPAWVIRSLQGSPRLRTHAAFHVSPQGHLQEFQVQLWIGESIEPIQVEGVVEGTQLNIRFQIEGQRHQLPPLYYRPHSLVGDAFSPQDRLPPLRVGEAWSASIVNPLTQQVELLQSEVVGREIITWGDQPIHALVVRQQGGGLTARTWVRHDGLVLKQEIPLWWSTFTFVREPETDIR